MSLKILIATDSFKSSLSSENIGKILHNALIDSKLPIEILQSKLADGGEGSLLAIEESVNCKKISVSVYNPLFEAINAYYLYEPFEKTAFVELAQSSGIASLRGKPDIMNSSTYGTGRLLKHAIEQGAKHIVLFVGGSATNDSGLGILSALGFKFEDKKGNSINPLPKNILQIHKVDDNKSILKNKNIKITIAADVTNPFYGLQGASHSYAAQKGATKQEIEELEESFKYLAKLFCLMYGIDIQSIKGSGAAGGVAGGLYALAGARIVSGAEYIFNVLNIEQKVKNADIVISGEGKIDNQSVNNKLLFALSKLTKKHNKELWAICGYFEGNEQLLQELNVNKLFPFTKNKKDIKNSIANAEKKLKTVSLQIVREVRIKTTLNNKIIL